MERADQVPGGNWWKKEVAFALLIGTDSALIHVIKNAWHYCELSEGVFFGILYGIIPFVVALILALWLKIGNKTFSWWLWGSRALAIVAVVVVVYMQSTGLVDQQGRTCMAWFWTKVMRPL